MIAKSDMSRSAVPFTELLDLVSEKMGGRALFTNDEFFAGKENLVKAAAAVFIPDKYTDLGKWMDGWESRRKRNLGPGNDHDWCVLKLGAPGVVRGVNVDTAFFTGNFPESASIEGTDYFNGATTVWKTLLPQTKLQGGSSN